MTAMTEVCRAEKHFIKQGVRTEPGRRGTTEKDIGNIFQRIWKANMRRERNKGSSIAQRQSTGLKCLTIGFYAHLKQAPLPPHKKRKKQTKSHSRKRNSMCEGMKKVRNYCTQNTAGTSIQLCSRMSKDKNTGQSLDGQ